MADRAHKEGVPSLPYMLTLVAIISSYQVYFGFVLAHVEEPHKGRLMSQQVFLLLVIAITAVSLPAILWSLKTRLVAARGNFVKIARKMSELVKKLYALGYKLIFAVVAIVSVVQTIKQLKEWWSIYF